MKRTFRKAATTPFFKKKVKLADWLLTNLEPIPGSYKNQRYFKSGTVRDPERGVYIDVSIDYKCVGFGKGRPIRCGLHWSETFHPELKGVALCPADINVLSAQIK